jgi:hypothetical protein
VACTLDTSRLFASYRNGSIAVVLDASGNGSVMTPSGRCVLNLRGGGAEAMDDKGAVVCVYSKEGQGRGGGTAKEAEWEFDGVKVVFTPSNWEVRAMPHDWLPAGRVDVDRGIDGLTFACVRCEVVCGHQQRTSGVCIFQCIWR